MNRLIGVLSLLGLTMTLAGCALPGTGDNAVLPSLDPFVTLLDMHPVSPSTFQGAQQAPMVMPHVVHQGEAASDSGSVQVPAVVTPQQQGEQGPGTIDGKAGTGFFIGEDGTLLTAAHVASGCGRLQIISKYVARTWVSLLASDQEHDVAILKSPGPRPPAVMRIAAAAPTSGRLFVLGYPATAGLIVPAETWAVLENDKFPGTIGPLASPRELLWMSAPEVTHGYSGGPIFDPRVGAVVGIVKGEVDGGYLRLIRDMPTTGIAIGPGIGQIEALVRREVPYTPVSLVSSPGDGGLETLRRATVHVLCWR